MQGPFALCKFFRFALGCSGHRAGLERALLDHRSGILKPARARFR